MHTCATYEEWLMAGHYMCHCGHVEWSHYPNGSCAHCRCAGYSGEKRPLSHHERASAQLTLNTPEGHK